MEMEYISPSNTSQQFVFVNNPNNFSNYYNTNFFPIPNFFYIPIYTPNFFPNQFNTCFYSNTNSFSNPYYNNSAFLSNVQSPLIPPNFVQPNNVTQRNNFNY